MANLYLPPTQNALQYTLDTQLVAAGTSLTLNSSVAGIVQAPGVFVIDRVDSSGNETASKREYISFTGVSGANLTGLVRGLAGSTDQVHAVGAIVEFVPDVLQQQAIYDAITLEHSVLGQHLSLVSLAQIRAFNIVGWSAASLNSLNVRSLAIPSLASIQELNVVANANFSGASIFANFPVTPVWVITGAVSAATTAVGKPIDMPQGGNIEWVSVALRSPVSAASLIIDINKNFTSIFEAGTRPFILGGGTFVSSASINTKAFISGDIFSADVDAGGSFQDATIKVRGR